MCTRSITLNSKFCFSSLSGSLKQGWAAFFRNLEKLQDRQDERAWGWFVVGWLVGWLWWIFKFSFWWIFHVGRYACLCMEVEVGRWGYDDGWGMVLRNLDLHDIRWIDMRVIGWGEGEEGRPLLRDMHVRLFLFLCDGHEFQVYHNNISLFMYLWSNHLNMQSCPFYLNARAGWAVRRKQSQKRVCMYRYCLEIGDVVLKRVCVFVRGGM